MAGIVITILGCGSSGGVPRLGGAGGRGDWGACNAADPRNRRRRCSLLVERSGARGTTRVLIDTSPDMRMQLLDAGIGTLDAVVYTHGHADHVHGIDDLRPIVFAMNRRLPVWADAPTRGELLEKFGYVFAQPDGSPYQPILDLHDIAGDIVIDGAGGTVRLQPVRVNHGTIDALGFRIGGLAYLPDVLDIYPDSWPLLAGLDCWIVDALRRKPHPTHAHLALTLDWIRRAAPRRAVLTNLHLDFDYAELAAELPDSVMPAHDGMTIALAD